MCQVCTLAVGAGIGLSRWLGVDDTISGLWIGALILSSSLWLAGWLTKKFPNIKYPSILVSGIIYVITLAPLFWADILTNKLAAGIAAGSLVFLLAIFLDKKVRQIKGKQLFNFQKIVFPVTFLLISSLIIWIVTRH